MARHFVDIRFDAARRQILCLPHKLIVKRLDFVEWGCTTGQPFTVDFGWDSPFPEIAYAAEAKRMKRVAVPRSAPEGRYEYFVALFDPRSGLVYTLDPDMIIRR